MSNGFEGRFIIRSPRSEEEMRETYALRYREYCRIGSFQKEDFPDGLEKDGYDETAQHFISLLDGAIVGSIRVCFQVDDRFLMETGSDAFSLPTWFPREPTCELSRLVAPSIGLSGSYSGAVRFRQSLYLLRAACRWSLNHGYRYCVAAWQKAFFERLKEKGFPLLVLGAGKSYHHTEVIPCAGYPEILSAYLSSVLEEK